MPAYYPINYLPVRNGCVQVECVVCPADESNRDPITEDYLQAQQANVTTTERRTNT